MRASSFLRLVDTPTEDRKLHTVAIPRTGGFGIVIGVFFSLSFWLKPEGYLWSLLVSSAIIVVFGLLDDRFDLHFSWKFLGQIAAVLVLLAGGVVIDVVPLLGLNAAPVWISYPLSFFFILGSINAVNLTDGLDGLAAGVILLSLGLIAVLAYQVNSEAIVLVALAVMGGLLGFLRYNTFPARVFMGDTGSQFLGLITVSLAILVSQHESSAISPALPLLILGLPILDTLMVMVIRRVKGHSIFRPDNNHIHYQLTQMGFQHYEAVAVLYALQAVLVSMAWYFRYAVDLVVLFNYLLFSMIVVGSIGVIRITEWRVRSNTPSLEIKNRRNNWLRNFHWLHRYSSTLLEVALAAFICVTPFFVSHSIADIGNLSLGVALASSVLWLCFRKGNAMVTRVIFHSASILLMYSLLTSTENHPDFDRVIDSALVAILLVLFLAVRLTRKELFRLDTQDYLVMFIICAVPFLPFGGANDLDIGRFTLRLSVLLYGCEYLLSKDPKNNVLLKASAIASTVLWAVLD